jgi:hypothetical protein
LSAPKKSMSLILSLWQKAASLNPTPNANKRYLD